MVDLFATRLEVHERPVGSVKNGNDLLRKEKTHKKIPRRMEGYDVVKVLVNDFGFASSRIRGSHAILYKHNSEQGKPSCRVVVPLHGAIKIGTLKGIMNEASDQAHIPIEALIERLG